MQLRQLGPNQTEMRLTDNVIVLFSYETPGVAARVLTSSMDYYRTEVKYGKTTTKHINGWLPKDQCVTKPQSFFDELVK